MKSYKKILWLTWIAGCIIYSNRGYCNPLVRVADSLFRSGNYRHALIEYEKAYFFSDEPVEQVIALLRKSECLRQSGDFGAAEKCILRINYNTIPDSLVFRGKIQTALISYLNRDFPMAESNLTQIRFQVADSSLVKSSYFLYALVLNEMQRWDEAKVFLTQWINGFETSNHIKDSITNEFETIYLVKNQPRMKNLWTAKILSMLIPGAGQIYCGYIGDGITSFTIQAIALAATGAAVYFGYYVTAFIVPFSVFQKFYYGSQLRLEYLVEKRNYERLRRYNDPIKEKLLHLNEYMKT